VEREAALATTFAGVLGRRAQFVRWVPTAAAACRQLRDLRPDLLLIDMAVPGAFDVLAGMQSLDPLPLVVAVCATERAEESFRLGHLGVRTLLKKPVTVDSLDAALDWALLRPTNVVAHAA
jgi:DNA-binding response OmpR family regulator